MYTSMTKHIYDGMNIYVPAANAEPNAYKMYHIYHIHT